MEQIKHITEYLKAVNTLYAKGITTEHSFRGDLAMLLKNMTNYVIVNEAQHIDCGAPDLTLLSKDIPVGYVEAKDISKNLNDKIYKEQFTRYKKALDNLIITDYVTFQFFKGEEFIAEVKIGNIQPNKIEPISSNFNKFIELINDFSLYNGKPIRNSGQLAEFMAAKAQLLAETIEKTLDTNGENGSLYQQLQGFKKVLLSTIDNKQFADMYAQTIAYGMFVARLQDNSNTDFTRQRAENLIPKSNPFLRNLFHYIAYDIDENIVWIVDSLADMFNHTAIDDIHREFVSKDKDPFLHFYEDFLTKYDKTLKNAKGAYYTPQAVVQFIVGAVDDILKTDFNLSKGLADNSKVSRETNGKTTEYHKVQILDPATGTGTFLAEVVRNIHRKFENNAGVWNDYVSQHLIPRLNGFEIMMSPYTMAHLKLEMILQEFGYNANDKNRLQIYLTDSLENSDKKVQQIPFAQWLSNEAAEAQKIKNDVPVMVVLGNPPYSVSSTNKGKWIENLMADYKKNLNERNIQPLSDDYIKFIRFGQHFIDKNGEGILAYISNNSFIDGLIHRQMRKSLMETFDKIYILDLHGNAKKKETAPDGSKDENVFDIQQGVSINIFVKTRNTTEHEYKIYHFDLYGKRHEKYNFLLENNLNTIPWTELHPETPNYFFVPKDFSSQEEYDKGFSITELFPVNSSGIKTQRDDASIFFTQEEREKTKSDFLNLTEEELKQKYGFVNVRDWAINAAKNDLQISNILADKIQYRPFDYRYMLYTGKTKGIMGYPRYEVMQHFIKGENFGLISSRQFGGHEHFICFISNKIIEISSQPFAPYSIFPLYLYPANDLFGGTERKPNLNAAIVSEITRGFNPLSITPEQIFDYIYAVLHSPTYREKYKEFLKIDFPRIPYPENAEYFNKMATFGERLRKLHLMDISTTLNNQNHFANFPIKGSNAVENSFTEKSNDYHDGKVWINDTQYFDNVPQAAWSFYIGGYQPAPKWLKDRKNRTLSYEDVEHYQKIIFVLNEMDRIMREIDLFCGQKIR